MGATGALLLLLAGLTTPVLAAEDPPIFLFGWGTYGDGEGEFKLPRGVALDGDGNVYVVDPYNYRVQKFEADGDFITEWGSQGTGTDQFVLPFDVAVDSSGDVWVSDYSNHCVRKYRDSGGNAYGCILTIGTPGTSGTGDGVFNLPWGLDVDDDDNLYVADNYNHRIQKFSSAGTFLTAWGLPDSNDASPGGYFENPTEVAVDSSGNVYVADNNNYRVQRFHWDPDLGDAGEYAFDSMWGVSSGGLYGLTVDSQGDVYVTDYAGYLVRKYDGAGELLTSWGTSGSCESCLGHPWGIAVAENGDVYVADNENCRIQVFGESTSVDVDISLAIGWNMVSVPVEAADMSVDAVFPDAEAVYWWDPATKSYTVPTTIAPELSYWVAVTSADTVTVTGTPVTEWTDELAAGWNMAGSVYGDPVAVGDLVDNPDGSVQMNAIYHWNPGTKSYDVATQIAQGLGYWMAATGTCDLTVAPSA